MASIRQDLKLKSDPSTIVYPNIIGDCIPEESIQGNQIIDDTIGEDHLIAESVTTSKIADGAVTTIKINNSAVTTGKIASNAVTTGKLAGGAVTSSILSDNAVTTQKIYDGAVTYAKCHIREYPYTYLSSVTLSDLITWLDGTALGSVKFFITNPYTEEIQFAVGANDIVVWYYDDSSSNFKKEILDSDANLNAFVSTYRLTILVHE